MRKGSAFNGFGVEIEDLWNLWMTELFELDVFSLPQFFHLWIDGGDMETLDSDISTRLRLSKPN